MYLFTLDTGKMLSLALIFSCFSVQHKTLYIGDASYSNRDRRTFTRLLFFSCSVMSDTLRSHGLQHTRLPCPSLSPGVCQNSSPLSWWCHPTISSSVDPFSLALNLSQHQCLLQWVSSLHQALKYWSFILSISPSNEYLGLIFFGIHWFDLLDVKGILKSFLQHHCLKASIFQHSAFLMAQLSHPYINTRKTIALTLLTFVGKMMSLFWTHCLGLPFSQFGTSLLFHVRF